MRFCDLAFELLAVVLVFHININSRFENASRSCARFKVAVLRRCSGTQSLSNEQEMGYDSKKQKMEQVAVVGQCEGGIRVAGILGHTARLKYLQKRLHIIFCYTLLLRRQCFPNGHTVGQSVPYREWCAPSYLWVTIRRDRKWNYSL